MQSLYNVRLVLVLVLIRQSILVVILRQLQHFKQLSLN